MKPDFSKLQFIPADILKDVCPEVTQHTPPLPKIAEPSCCFYTEVLTRLDRIESKIDSCLQQQ
jgi:hypothetical protein